MLLQAASASTVLFRLIEHSVGWPDTPVNQGSPCLSFIRLLPCPAVLWARTFSPPSVRQPRPPAPTCLARKLTCTEDATVASGTNTLLRRRGAHPNGCKSATCVELVTADAREGLQDTCTLRPCGVGRCGNAVATARPLVAMETVCMVAAKGVVEVGNAGVGAAWALHTTHRKKAETL